MHLEALVHQIGGVHCVLKRGPSAPRGSAVMHVDFNGADLRGLQKANLIDTSFQLVDFSDAKALSINNICNP